MTLLEDDQDWIQDCLPYGRVLTGKYSHWCLDWDGMPIDETCPEFECCTCYRINGSLIKID